MLSRKDYIELAELIAKAEYNNESLEIFVSRLCSFLRRDNESFDNVRFYKYIEKVKEDIRKSEMGE